MSKQDKNVIIGLIIIVFGGLMLLDSFGFIYFNFWRMLGKFWPVILIVIGVLIILERDKTKPQEESPEKPPEDKSGGNTSRESTAFGILGDIRLAGFTQVPDTIDRSLLIGDIVIDLSNSRLSEGESRINVSVLVGDIDVILPADFPVNAEISCLVGSTTVDRRKSDGLAPNVKHEDDNYPGAPARLAIHGRALIGDITVLHVAR